MFEFWFTFTAAYLAYVGYEAHRAIQCAEKGEPVLKPKDTPAPAATIPAATPAPVAKAQPAAAPAVKVAAAKAETAPTAKPQPAPAPAKPAAPVKAAPVKASDEPARLADELRNPATGEVTAAPGNYRFAKKWIKEALVQEKLLDRIYKPNELDDATSLKVKEAIDKLRTMKKYQA
ncbi:MAG: hypothetical protein ACKN9W_03140 [Methylococcus sp.]